MPETMPPVEAFHNGFYYFIRALSILAEDPETQCKLMGDCNVAWELHRDVGDGEYLANNAEGQLFREERDAILALMHLLEEVPVSELPAGDGRNQNLTAMMHPAWRPLRVQAASLLEVLKPAITRNKNHFDLQGTID